ncbi:MAG: hypothetical protein SF339_08620 [Blastocatellia bacterium]|nr:hypothetical protein [Blastocatellia bacterium]
MLVRMGGKPKFSLVMLLERAPQTGEESIRPLIVSGYLGLELDYALPPAVAAAMPVQPIFARQAQLELHARARGLLTQVSLNISRLRGALHTHLKREELLGVLDALDGRPSYLELRAKIEFRATAPDSCVELKISAAALWDLLKAASAAGFLAEDALQAVFDNLVKTGVLSVPAGADRGHLFRVFRESCALLLRPEAAGCVLGRRPSEGSIALHERWQREVTRQVELSCQLEQVLGGALDDSGWAASLRVVGPSGDLDGGELLANLQRVQPKSFRGNLSGASVAVVGNRLQTIAAVLQPTIKPQPTTAIIATDAIRLPQPAPNNSVVHYLTPHVTFLANALPGDKPRSLPVVSDANAPLFTDRINQALRWYLPSVQLLRPAPNEAPENSPFLFELERLGATVSGRPAIRARIRLTFELGMPAGVSTALARLSGVNAQPVNLIQPTVVLKVPYLDETDGMLKRASYRGVVTLNRNRLQAVIELLNDAARTTYGSLSTAGFQSEPAQVEFSYQFECYTPLAEKPSVLVGGKVSQAHILPFTREVDDAIVVATAGREFRLRPEKPGPLASAALGSNVLAATALSSNTPSPFTPLSSSALVTGRLQLSANATVLPQKIEYAQKVIIRQQSLEAFFSCDQLGAFYRENQPTATVAIGCAEAYRLGQASSRTYQEIPGLARPAYRVFRNLQQPGRFLLAPLTYQITRYSAEMAERAYRPVIFIYAVLDPARPENERIRYDAMLAPAIAPAEYRQLLQALAAEAQQPILELPNMLASQVTYQWNLSANLAVEVTTDRTPDCFHVGLSTGLASALLLKSLIQNTGIAGEARFTFEDGTVLTSALSLNLGQITGPWPAGPVEISRSGAVFKLLNRSESTLAVQDLVLFAAGRASTRLAVEKQLAAGAALDVPATGTFDDAEADFVPIGGNSATLEEIRSMIEDIRSNVVFVDLVNYDNYGLERLEVEARLKGVPGTSPVRMENRRGTVDFLLPLTTYLAARSVEYRVNKVFRTRPPEMTAWLEWNMDANSNIVSIVWEAIR